MVSTLLDRNGIETGLFPLFEEDFSVVNNAVTISVQIDTIFAPATVEVTVSIPCHIRVGPGVAAATTADPIVMPERPGIFRGDTSWTVTALSASGNAASAGVRTFEDEGSGGGRRNGGSKVSPRPTLAKDGNGRAIAGAFLYPNSGITGELVDGVGTGAVSQLVVGAPGRWAVVQVFGLADSITAHVKLNGIPAVTDTLVTDGIPHLMRFNAGDTIGVLHHSTHTFGFLGINYLPEVAE